MRWCAAGHGRPPREKSWAGAATPAQLDTITARVRANGSSAADQVNNLSRKDNKDNTAARLTDWMARGLQQLGDLVFASKDQEAAWHAWDVERRCAGLGRLYRDPRFDALVSCPGCDRISTVADGTVCPQCSATDHLVHA